MRPELREKKEMPWDMPTIGRMIESTATTYGRRPVMRTIVEKGVTHSLYYSELWDLALIGTARLLGTGMRKGDRAIVLSDNTNDRLVFDISITCAGGVSVPLHPASSAERISKVLDLVRPFLIYVQGDYPDEWPIVERLRDDGWGLDDVPQRRRGSKAFVVRGRAQRGHRWRSKARSIRDMETPLPQVLEAVHAVVPSDPCFIMFTSGTSGSPKGVTLTHGNVLHQMRATNRFWSIGPEDVFLTHLPWHHSFGGILERFLALTHGSCMAIVPRGMASMLAVLTAWEAVKPTIIFSVPTIHRAASMSARTSDEARKALFHPGLRFIHTAAAPLPPETGEFFRSNGVDVAVGWGLTETSPCCTLGWAKSSSAPGFVGRPIPGVELRLDEDGEILVRGPNVMPGYYGSPEATAAFLSRDGWLRTGDLGEFDKLGNLILTGRADAMVKLSNGEKVPTSLIESALVGSDHLISHAVVVGGPASSGGNGGDFVAALLFADAAPMKGADERFCRAVRAVNERLEREYERVRVFTVLDGLPRLGGDLLTVSGKVMRPKLLDRYSSIIDGIYSRGIKKTRGPDVVPYRPG